MEPLTRTVLFGASTSLFHAAITTVPVLVVSPAAIVSVVPVCVKSPDTAGDSAEAVTITVTSSLDLRFSVAVTVLEPPFSEISSGARTRVTVGVASLSVIVSVWFAGADTPLPPDTEPLTVTVLSGACTSLSRAVIVTVPVLVVEPAPIVSVVPAWVKSADDAGDVDTVTVTSSLDAPVSVAVTTLWPSFSEISAGVSTSVTVGVASSSVIVSVWFAGADTPCPPDTEPLTVTCIFGASTSLFSAAIVTVPVLVVEPAAIVSVVPLWVKPAGVVGDVDTVTVTASLDSPVKRAVTVLRPPFSEISSGVSSSVTVGVASSSVIVSV